MSEETKPSDDEELRFKVTEVVRESYRSFWACEAVRGETARRTSKKWRWEVWRVIGGRRLYRGEVAGRRRAEEMVVAALIVAAAGMRDEKREPVIA